MRAKFRVESVTKHAYGGEQASLRAVMADELEENQRFNKASPSGELSITIDNPAAQGFLQPGKSYYLDFSPAEG